MFKIVGGSENFFKFFLDFKRFLFRKYSIGTSQLVLSFKHFSKVKFAIPPLAEQTAIAAILTQADEEIRLLREKERALQAQKKGLMQRLLTGKIRVKT